jgi:hypothetical protein
MTHSHRRAGDSDHADIDYGKPQGIQVCDLHGIRENQFTLMKNDIHDTKQLSKVSLMVSAGTLGCTIALLVLHFLPRASQTLTLIP